MRNVLGNLLDLPQNPIFVGFQATPYLLAALRAAREARAPLEMRGRLEEVARLR